MAPDVGPRNVPGRRNRKPRPTQLAKLPASVVRMPSSGTIRRSAVTIRPGWTPGPSHGVSSTTEAASHADRSSRLAPWRVATTRGVEHGPTEQSLVGSLEERLGVGDDRRASAESSRSSRPGSRSTWAQGRPCARHRVAERRRLVEPRADDERAHRRRRAARGPSRGHRSRPSRGRAGDRSRRHPRAARRR